MSRRGETPAVPALSASHLVVRHGDLVAVNDVSLDLYAGEVTALTGRNGSGKTTLLWAVQGSGPLTAGAVAVAGQDPRDLSPSARRRAVGLVPQTPSDLLYLPTVAEECAQADKETGSAPGTCRDLLDRVVPGIPGDAHPRDLSEGQRLALVLAVQLTADPGVLLLDEPTRGLDYPGKAVLAAVLRDLAARGRAVLLSTHDVEFVAQVADRVLVMAGGELVADGPTAAVVTASPAYAPQVAKALGHGLLTPADARERLGGSTP